MTEPPKHVKTWRLDVTEKEMQCVANLLGALFKMCTTQGIMVPPEQALIAMDFLNKAKAILSGKKPIILVQ